VKGRKAPPDEKRAHKRTWEEIYLELETARQALERGGKPLPEDKRAILKARAQALAQEPKQENEAGESIELIEFLLAHEKYAIESSCIREVYPLKDYTPLPCTPPFILGIISVRGQIISVVDLKKFFGLPEKGLTDLNKVIILHSREMRFGVLADAILGVRIVAVGSIQPPLATLTGIGAEYIRGLTGEGLIVLNGNKILSDSRMVVHEQV
jgi:purine-binding chemotaxis protein CheW